MCDDNWDDNDANVVCRQLGFYGEQAFSEAYFGEGTGPILLSEVNCTGTERVFTDCPSSGIGNHNCSHAEDAGVRCIAGIC